MSTLLFSMTMTRTPSSLLAEWVGGGNETRAGFYNYFFDRIFQFGKCYISDIPNNWDDRSIRRWVARVCDGDSTQIGLEICIRKRDGRRGKVYYQFSHQLIADIEKIWKSAKKVIG